MCPRTSRVLAQQLLCAVEAPVDEKGGTSAPTSERGGQWWAIERMHGGKSWSWSWRWSVELNTITTTALYTKACLDFLGGKQSAAGVAT